MKINYAQNPHRIELHAHIMDWLAQPLNFDGAAKWLLLDAAMLDEETMRRLMHKSSLNTVHNVFDHSRFAVYRNAAPCLIRLDALDPITQGKALKKLLDITNGLPMLSILDAGSDIATISRSLQWLADIATDDGLELYCRFADTRITPALLKVLDAQQRTGIGEVIHRWQVVNRFGVLENIFSASDAASPVQALESVLPFVLTDGQYGALMLASEMDEIFQMVSEASPELIPDDDQGNFYQRLVQIVGNARRRGLENSCDVFQFTVIALSTQDCFDLHPVLDDTWLQFSKDKKRFSILVAAWSDAVWDALPRPIPFSKNDE